MDPITAFGVVVNVASLADVAFHVFKEILDYYHEVKSAPAKSRELQDELFAISNVARDMSALVCKTSVETHGVITNESIGQFRELLKDIEAKIIVPKRSLNKRLKWPFTMKENEEYITRLERFKATFTLALNVYQRYYILTPDSDLF